MTKNIERASCKYSETGSLDKLGEKRFTFFAGAKKGTGATRRIVFQTDEYFLACLSYGACSRTATPASAVAKAIMASKTAPAGER